MRKTFDKALATTLMVGSAAFGIYVGLCILRVALEVAGTLLGTSFGTILVALLIYKFYERKWKK